MAQGRFCRTAADGNLGVVAWISVRPAAMIRLSRAGRQSCLSILLVDMPQQIRGRSRRPLSQAHAMGTGRPGPREPDTPDRCIPRSRVTHQVSSVSVVGNALRMRSVKI